MLNQADDRGVDQKKGREAGHDGAETSQWCVGEPPVRWDVSFPARLAEKIWQIFWREPGDRAVPEGPGPRPVGVGMRKAA